MNTWNVYQGGWYYPLICLAVYKTWLSWHQNAKVYNNAIIYYKNLIFTNPYQIYIYIKKETIVLA